jgi:hypothetical protein
VSGIHHFVPIRSAATAAAARFLIGSDSGSLKYSDDGVNWTTVSIAPSIPEAIGWNGSYYVAVGGGAAKVSSDAAVWTGTGDTLGGGVLNQVAWSPANNKWVTGSSVSSTLLVSTDGLTWTNGASVAANLNAVSGAWHDDVSGRTFVFGDASFSGVPLLYSTDLTTWTPVGTITNALATGVFSMARDGSNLYATSYVSSTNSRVWRSLDDGDTWTAIFTDNTIVDGFLRSAAIPGLFVTQYSNTDIIYYSTDGVNVNGPITTTGGGAGLRGLVGKNGKIWINKRTGEVWSSTDGANWSLEDDTPDPLFGDWLGFGFP